MCSKASSDLDHRRRHFLTFNLLASHSLQTVLPHQLILGVCWDLRSYLLGVLENSLQVIDPYLVATAANCHRDVFLAH